MSVRLFLEELRSEWVDWVKQAAFPSAGGLHAVHREPEEHKTVVEERILCLDIGFSCPQTGTYTATSSGSSAWDSRMYTTATQSYFLLVRFLQRTLTRMASRYHPPPQPPSSGSSLEPGSESVFVSGRKEEGEAEGAGTDSGAHLQGWSADKHVALASQVSGTPAPCPPVAMATCKGRLLMNPRKALLVPFSGHIT